MSDKKEIVPFSLKDAPALIEKLFPAQKLSIEAYKEQMANLGKTLTALGSYWKGRKPLILNKACILGALLPATSNLKQDLEIYEKLMGMDSESLVVRLGRIKPSDIVERLSLNNIERYFCIEPKGVLPQNSPFNINNYITDNCKNIKITWNNDISDNERRKIESLALPKLSYRELIEKADRPEMCENDLDSHIWDEVNSHFGTNANSIQEFIEQLGIMRYGHRPKVADTFCGSGQIPFEAARLGCNVYASDLNPIACMLTWGAFNIIGGTSENRNKIFTEQKELVSNLKIDIDKLGVESDGNGWKAKTFLYCLESKCPQSGWMVPLLPTFVISKDKNVIVELIPDNSNKRYNISVRYNVSDAEMIVAKQGTVRSEGRGKEPYLIHSVNGVVWRPRFSWTRK